MHHIKRRAHRTAWFQNLSEGTKTYNIFARADTQSPRLHNDEEKLTHTATDSAVSPIEDKRRTEAAAEIRPYTGPPKASTFPRHHYEQDIYSPELNGKGKTPEIATNVEDEKTNQPLYSDSAQPAGSIEQTVTSSSTDGTRRRGKGRKYFNFSGSNTTASNVDVSNGVEVDEKKDLNQLTIGSQFKAVIWSPINVLLVFVPIGIALNYALGQGNTERIVVFVVNFIAIIPLAAILSYSTEELALYIGEVLGGLLNASFGNAVELIVSIIALTKQEILIVQTSLIGSMLSNLLLVLGMCMTAGGTLGRYKQQSINMLVAQTATSMLALAIGSLIIPTAFQMFEDHPGGVTQTSRGTAVILLFVYACYLYFQLSTHSDLFNEVSESDESQKMPSKKKGTGEAIKAMAEAGHVGVVSLGGGLNQNHTKPQENEEAPVPQLTRVGALCSLAVSTVLVALCAEYLVSSISAVSQHVSQEFIGLILLPIVGNAAEHATAVTVAIKGKMDLAIGVAVGSGLQIALLVLPIMVLLNWWGVGSPSDLTLSFDGFQVSALFIAIIIVNYVIQDGKTNYLEGIMLQATYLIIAVSAWFYKTDANVAG